MKIAPKHYARAVVAALQESKDVDTIATATIERLARDGRLRDVGRILVIIARLLNAEADAEDVHITTARPLTKKMQKEATDALRTTLAVKKIHATFAEDPALIGGAVIAYGDTRMDGSVRRQLTTLQQALTLP